MRLTLRTLLAWLDDLLPADETRELGGKVQASGAARHLIERIRTAVARGPLPAVDTDPNTVAEYLDNVLAVEQLVAFERGCLESEAKLAEVAGCHAALAEFLREQPARQPEEQPAATVEPTVATVRPRSPSPPRQQATAAAWLALVAAVVLLVTLVGLLGWTLVRSRSGRPPVAEPAAVAMATAEPRAAPATDPEPPRPRPPEDALAEPEAIVSLTPPQAAPPAVPPAPPPAVGSAPALAPPAAVPAAAPAPAPNVPPPGAAEPRVPFGDALAIVAPPSVPAPGPPIPPPAVGLPAPEPDAAGHARDDAAPDDAARDDAADRDTPRVTGGAVLRRVDEGDAATWQAVTVGQRFARPALLIAPACGRPVITLDGFRLTLSPGTQLSLAADTDGIPRLTIGFGSVLVATDRTAARIGVTVGDLAGIATLGPAGPLAVDVNLERDPGADPEESEARRTARVMSLNAPVVWRQTAADGGLADPPLTGVRHEQEIPARTAVVWSSDDPATAHLKTLGLLPAWITGSSDRLDRAAAEALATRFAAGDPAAAALRDLVAAGRAETRTAAAATLALLGEYDEAARLLCGELPGDELREEQWRALESAVVPLAFARGPRAAVALTDAFGAHAPAGRGADIVRLARGLGDAELAADAAAALVAALDAPQLVVRRYAFKNLIEITAASGVDRLRYRPDRPESLRREGLAWWQAQLAQGRIRRADAAGPAPRP